MTEKSPIRPTDEDARALARALISEARFAALAVTDPETGAPSVTRIAIATAPDAAPLTLISDLSSHTAALRADPRCALLLGEPAEKGDPLTHPRLTVHAKACFVPRDSEEHTALRSHYLAQRPKAKLYVDFGDFSFVRFDALSGLLNGGFGKAFKLTPVDMLAPSSPA
ncbi:pyridoxamine 5'-phosphate oxidase family protein [Shimia sp. R9_1]|uniref:HugZ family pyridoxamine 5'-phosphate oxidase n=1 Tax=Shimia sp. R9_1 TaxID=2821111 RepID=UPI001ADA8ABF|nr:pyridoxamine 5'-phosphate oxidase family protein [Shimia sp. R9_1]MBO9406469.1 pyridoxamine 5'-phosphate oxidase family protein [Shimia sp. R9_1]